MTVINKETAGAPKIAPLGERIYEMIGPPEVEAMSLALVEVASGDGSPKHIHKKLTEIYIVTKGQMKLVVDAEESTLNPGDAALIKPGQVHQLFNEGKETLEFWVPTAPAWYAEDFHEVE